VVAEKSEVDAKDTGLTEAIIGGLHPGQLFHVGIVATDIDKAMAEMSVAQGVTWKGGRPVLMDLTLFGEDRSLEMRIAHTVQGPPHIELIQAAPNTPWDPARPGVHHLCYWSDLPGPICRSLEAAGYERLLGRPDADSGYFQSPGGMIVEIIGRELHDNLSTWLTRAKT
jgi:hypothetical protein